MNDKELAQKLRHLAVDMDLSGRTAEWKVAAEAALRLDELASLREQVELTATLSFWERWTMEWRTTCALLNRYIEVNTPESLRHALAVYASTREGYQHELKTLLAKDPTQWN